MISEKSIVGGFYNTFDFTGVSCFNLGDIITVSVTPEVAVGDLVWTLVLEYYID